LANTLSLEGAAMTENAKTLMDVAALSVARGKFTTTPEERELMETLTLEECQEVARRCRLKSRLWLKQARLYETLARQR
jgi:hypothetical protein